METFWQDLRFSLRTLLRNLGFTFVAVTTLVLGIAATSAVATVVSAVLLHDLPFPEPDRLLQLKSYKDEKGTRETLPSSYLDYQDWKKKVGSFVDVGVHSGSIALNLLTAGEPERVNSEVVDSAYFRLLGVQPVVGRAISPEDDAKPGAPRIAVLSHALWQRRFGGDPRVLGGSLVLDGESYQVVGVMPARFHGLTDEADLWLPVTMGNEILGNPRFLDRRGVRWLTALARLKPGVSQAQAQHEMDALDAALAREYPDTDAGLVVQLETLRQSLFGDLRFALLTLLGAALFVLLIAWTAVANLLLARATARRREIAVRSALGATRVRLLRQLLTESLALAGISCLLGLLLARATTRLLVTFPSFVDLGMDPRVALAIAGLSLLCGAAFGLTPAWLGVRDSAGMLREGSSTAGGARLRFQSSLVVAEVALALFLLIGAGLMIRGFARFRRTDLGFAPRNLLTVRVALNGKRYADGKVMIQRTRQYRDRLRALPGVGSVSIEAPTFPSEGWFGNSFIVEDLLAKTKDGVAFLVFHHVTPDYFRNLGIPLLAGRDFTDADNETSPLAIIISQGMARKYWPNESPLNKRMKFGRRDPNAPWFTVVGVVGDLNQNAMQEREWPAPDVYFDALQFPSTLIPVFTFLVRAAGVPPLALVEPVERELRSVAPELPPFDADTMEHRLEKFAAKGRFLVLLMTLFAGLALVIAAAGLYGVLYYSVTQRTRELGIRVALGARRVDVVGLVVRRAATLAAIGLAIGLAAALGLDRFFQSLFYGVSPTDLLTFLGTSLLLFLVAMAATYFPARRAVQVPPTISLRTE
jgi:putative ABC transport system permease protein